MRILLGVNTLTSVQNQVYANHLNLVYRLGKDHPDIEFILVNGYRSSIDRFRNHCAKIALQNMCNYLMFLDDDVLVPRETFTNLLAAIELGVADVVTPLVYIRGYPFAPMFFKEALIDGAVGLTHFDDFRDFVDEYGFVDCFAIGFSCCLFKCELLRDLPTPYFLTGPQHTEDVYFCCKLKEKFGKEVKIKVNTKIHAGHLLDNEFVHEDTREALKTYLETCDPTLLERHSGDRKQKYFEDVVKQFAAAYAEP